MKQNPTRRISRALYDFYHSKLHPLFERFARFRKSVQTSKGMRFAEPFIILGSIPFAFLLLELPYNQHLSSLTMPYIALNLLLIAFLLGAVYCLGQARRSVLCAFLGICFGIGTANHFVMQFKGQPIVPADIFALSTAADVGSQYGLAPDATVIGCAALLVAFCVLISFLPPRKLTLRFSAASTLCGIVFLFLIGSWYTSHDIEQDYHCTVDPWSVYESYSSQGSILCFTQRMQHLKPTEPADYNEGVVAALLEAYQSQAFADTNPAAPSVEDVPPFTEGNQPTVKPTIIAIMNETFSDLSRYPGLAESSARLETFYHYANQSEQKGYAYPSALGGGTCNSEFEFLTGSSMGHFGGGVYPYTLYDLEGTENLASYFSQLGYTTSAIHPAVGSNWRRDRIYKQLGFHNFYDLKSFEDAPLLRDLVTDRATYDCVLDLLATNEDPQFIFDVTIQNHGGYQVGGFAEEELAHVTFPDGNESDEVNEYVSCIQAAERDLDYLLSALDSLNRPVVICFFGDHQPSFADWLYTQTYEVESVDNSTLAEVQKRYEVPYFIWKNTAAKAEIPAREDLLNPEEIAEQALESAVDEQIQGQGAIERSANIEPSSLNYLGASLVDKAGLPLTPYQRFLLDTHESILAINMNGYLSTDYTWHYFDEDTEQTDLLRSYAQVQYRNLFRKK